MYTIKRVSSPDDPPSAEIAHIIRRLDRRIFPADRRLRPYNAGFYWLAYKDNRPVGFLSITNYRGVPFLERGGVLQTHRGHKLYQRMIRAAKLQCRKLNAKLIRTYTLPSNASSINGLIAAGFRSVAPELCYVGSDVCYWELPL